MQQRLHMNQACCLVVQDHTPQQRLLRAGTQLWQGRVELLLLQTPAVLFVALVRRKRRDLLSLLSWRSIAFPSNWNLQHSLKDKLSPSIENSTFKFYRQFFPCEIFRSLKVMFICSKDQVKKNCPFLPINTKEVCWGEDTRWLIEKEDLQLPSGCIVYRAIGWKFSLCYADERGPDCK